MDVNQRINLMNHMGLFHNPKFQVFYANIQINYIILHNLYKDVFATTSINFRKFAGWKKVFESPYILYKFVQ